MHKEENTVDLKVEDETDKIINEILEHWNDEEDDDDLSEFSRRNISVKNFD